MILFMKIIYLANYRLPTSSAHGLQVMRMCESFAASRPVQELLLIVPWRFNRIKQEVFVYYGGSRSFDVKKLPCLDILPLAPIFGCLAFFVQTLTFLLAARVYLSFKKCDILYTREPITGVFLKHFVLELHSLPKAINFIHRFIWRRARAIIVLTNYAKKELAAAGVPADKILAAPDAVEANIFVEPESIEAARQKLGLPLDKKIVLYSGHLYEWKGAATLAQAAKRFSGDVLVVFVGGEGEDLRNFQATYGVRSNIKIIPWQKRERVLIYLQAADVLVLPNSARERISAYYTSPLKLFEYMAAGRPIVASDLPSLREILNESNSFLVQADSPESFARGIKRVLANPVLAAKISAQALADVKNYTWPKRARAILDFLKRNNKNRQ